MRMFYFLGIMLTLLSATCSNSERDGVNPGFYQENFDVAYLINNPDTTFNLSKSLTEISGLTYSENLNLLYSINDEKGDIFSISPENGEVVDKFDFAKSDDYEGIAYANGIIYVAESNGNIKVVNEEGNERIGEYDDILSRDNDIEGLVYYEKDNVLLMAAKGDSEDGDNEKEYKSLFKMNRDDGSIDEEPFVRINLTEAVKKMEKRHITKNALVNLSVTSRIKRFAPSGVAIHPTTNDLYIVSARGRLLVVANMDGMVKAIIFMNQSMHVQPEGICFSSNGDLFISNEGRSRSGRIYKYSSIAIK